ncbi:MAG TPA: hypothetical protein VI875_04070 [Candidatus Norongarragalinales archaeon]|nr:hypothetical protein [Candidatus Norongarragalinales archaeon]
MDPLTVNFSIGLVFTSASAGVWFLQKEREEMVHRYASTDARLNEAEKVFAQLKAEERNLRKRQAKQASLSQLEDKMRKAEKTLVAVKARA